MVLNYWYITFIQETPLSNGWCVTIYTDVACHLYMRRTLKEPWKHPMPLTVRGLNTLEDTRFCFVAYNVLEQAQAGDTTAHTFVFSLDAISETSWFYLLGTVGGVMSPSTSPIVFLSTLQPISFENLSFEDWPPIPTAPEPWLKFTAGTGTSGWEQGIQGMFIPNFCCILKAGGFARMTGFRQSQSAVPYRNQTLDFVAQGYGYANPNTRLGVAVDGTGGWSRYHSITVTNWWQERIVTGLIPANATTIWIQVTVYSPGFGPTYCRWTQIRVNAP